MKIKLKKVVICLISCVSVFAVAVVCLATPANAAIYNISDFFEYNVIDKETDTRTAYFEVDVLPYVRVLDADSSVVASGFGSTDWRFPQLAEPRYTFSVHVYPFGGLLHTNAPASDCVLDVSDIMDGTDVILSADFECSVTTTQSGCNLNFEYRTFILAYDANMKLISTTKTDWSSATLIREGTQEFENDLSYTLPRNTFYIGMITQTKWTSPYSIGTMSFCISPRPVTLSVAIDMIYEQSQSMEKINQNLDVIISGTPQQNQIAQDKSNTITNQKDNLGSLVDQMQTNKPNMDNIDISAGSLAPSAGVSSLTGAISPILQNDLIKRILFMVATLALVSTVLFGKKE